MPNQGSSHLAKEVERTGSKSRKGNQVLGKVPILMCENTSVMMGAAAKMWTNGHVSGSIRCQNMSSFAWFHQYVFFAQRSSWDFTRRWGIWQIIHPFQYGLSDFTLDWRCARGTSWMFISNLHGKSRMWTCYWHIRCYIVNQHGSILSFCVWHQRFADGCVYLSDKPCQKVA